MEWRRAASGRTVDVMPHAGHFHAVRFYKDADGLCRIVANFLAEGFADGNPAIVIATPVHRAGIAAQLAHQSLDCAQLEATGALTMVDAEDTLAQFMIDGRPDAARFRDAITPVIERACAGRRDCTVRAYGEMVDVLWKKGQTVAATRLEMLWNQLANTHTFSLLCGYAMGNFYKDAAVEEICSHHSHVVSASGDVAVVN
jgi:hypothetical protein